MHALNMYTQLSNGARRMHFGLSISLHYWRMRSANALARLRGCAGSSEFLKHADVISTKIACAGPYYYCKQLYLAGIFIWRIWW